MSNIETSPGTLPHDLARRIGADPDFNEIHDQPSPQTMLGWAIRWAQRGLHLFPCKSFLGSPIPQKWYSVATSDIAQLVEWWNEIPNADIAAVPDLSGHFVLSVVGARGLASLTKLEDQYGELYPLFTTLGASASVHLWFKGRATTSRNLLGPGLHVCGPGTFVYMPASLAPDPE